MARPVPTINFRTSVAGTLTPDPNPALTTPSFGDTGDDCMFIAIVMESDTDSSCHTDNCSMATSGWDYVWTKKATLNFNTGGTYYLAEIYTMNMYNDKIITATHTRTGTRGSASATKQIHIIEVRNHNPQDPVGVTLSETLAGQDGAQSGTMSGAADSTSLFLAALCHDSSDTNNTNADPGSGWTELSDAATGGGGWTNIQTQYKLDASSSTAVPWADAAVDNTPGNWAGAIGIEIKAAKTPVLLSLLVESSHGGDNTIPYSTSIDTPALAGDGSDNTICLLSYSYSHPNLECNVALTDNVSPVPWTIVNERTEQTDSGNYMTVGIAYTERDNQDAIIISWDPDDIYNSLCYSVIEIANVDPNNIVDLTANTTDTVAYASGHTFSFGANSNNNVMIVSATGVSYTSSNPDTGEYYLNQNEISKRERFNANLTESPTGTHLEHCYTRGSDIGQHDWDFITGVDGRWSFVAVSFNGFPISEGALGNRPKIMKIIMT